jgi:hypothetical protein
VREGRNLGSVPPPAAVAERGGLSAAPMPLAGRKTAAAFRRCPDATRLVLQQHFVILGVSALVVGLSGAVLVASAPEGPRPGRSAVGDGGDQVCQETLGLAQREWDEAAARAFGAIAAVTAR